MKTSTIILLIVMLASICSLNLSANAEQRNEFRKLNQTETGQTITNQQGYIIVHNRAEGKTEYAAVLIRSNKLTDFEGMYVLPVKPEANIEQHMIGEACLLSGAITTNRILILSGVQPLKWL